MQKIWVGIVFVCVVLIGGLFVKWGGNLNFWEKTNDEEIQSTAILHEELYEEEYGERDHDQNTPTLGQGKEEKSDFEFTQVIQKEYKQDNSQESIFDEQVPFVIQAPDAHWDNPRYQDGCEEASLLMAFRWIQEKSILDPVEELNTISRRMEKKFNTFRDTSLEDNYEFSKDFLGTDDRILLRENITKEQMKEVIVSGNILAITVDGQMLKNPYFTPPGPGYHMLVVRGYDKNTHEFITNDPGTRKGEKYRYSEDVLYEAMIDYETGSHGKRYPEKKPALIFVGE